MDEFDELFKKFDENEILDKKDNLNICCNMPTISRDGNRICTKCGNVQFGIVFAEANRFSEPSSKWRKRSIYKRCDYFRHVLRLLTCRSPLLPNNYDDVINHLKTEQFETIIELKKIMKKLKYNLFYPFIYIIYFDIKGVILFDMTNKQFHYFCDLFKKIEWNFKKYNIENRHNFYSYNSFIYSLLLTNKIGDVNNMILPESHKFLLPKIDKVIQYLNNE